MSRGETNIRGAEKADILHMLADGHISHKIIAAKWGRHEKAIANFACDHRDEIDAIIADHSGKLSENWLLIKDNRCLELRDIYMPLRDRYFEMTDDPESDERILIKLSMELRSILKQAAEENGDLPNRYPNEGKPEEPPGWHVERESSDD